MDDYDELISLLRYSYKDAFLQIKLTMATLKGNTDVFRSGNNVFQFVSDSQFSSASSGYLYNNHLSNLNIEGGIIINQKSKLQLVAGVHFRTFTSLENTNYVYVALKTSISNLYYDF